VDEILTLLKVRQMACRRWIFHPRIYLFYLNNWWRIGRTTAGIFGYFIELFCVTEKILFFSMKSRIFFCLIFKQLRKLSWIFKQKYLRFSTFFFVDNFSTLLLHRNWFFFLMLNQFCKKKKTLYFLARCYLFLRFLLRKLLRKINLPEES